MANPRLQIPLLSLLVRVLSGWVWMEKRRIGRAVSALVLFVMVPCLYSGTWHCRLADWGELDCSLSLAINRWLSLVVVILRQKRQLVSVSAFPPCRTILSLMKDLTKYGSHVYVLVRRGELRASKFMAKRLMNHPKIVSWNHLRLIA